MTYTLSHFGISITLLIAAMLLAPPVLFDRSTAIEIGKYRVAWTRYGYSAQVNYQPGVSGLWPWDRLLRPHIYAE